MPDYKVLYNHLFDTITNVIEELRKAQIETVDALSDEMHKIRTLKQPSKFNSDIISTDEK